MLRLSLYDIYRIPCRIIANVQPRTSTPRSPLFVDSKPITTPYTAVSSLVISGCLLVFAFRQDTDFKVLTLAPSSAQQPPPDPHSVNPVTHRRTSHPVFGPFLFLDPVIHQAVSYESLQQPWDIFRPKTFSRVHPLRHVFRSRFPSLRPTCLRIPDSVLLFYFLTSFYLTIRFHPPGNSPPLRSTFQLPTQLPEYETRTTVAQPDTSTGTFEALPPRPRVSTQY